MLPVRPLATGPRHRARERGFTLIEVLVAILILSFGMLGAVGLQMSAMQANREARNQSAGVRYARELAEAMRANKLILSNASGPYFGNWSDKQSTPPATFTCDANNGCGTGLAGMTNLAQQDLSDWWARAVSELPGLRLRVCQDSNPYLGSGKAQWDCTLPAANTAGQSVIIKMGWTQTFRNASGSTGDAKITNADDATGPGSVPLIVIPVVN